jgi:predicted nuclease with TOPRIM domain
MKKLEADKIKLSEKWIKLSNKNKNEDKLKQRIKELETIQTAKNSEIMDLYCKIDEFEQMSKNYQKGKLQLNNSNN